MRTLKIVGVLFLSIGMTTVAVAQNGLVEKGKSIVAGQQCALCHTEDGPAKPMSKLAQDKSDDFLKNAILHPQSKPGAQIVMPPYTLTGEQIQAIIAYLRSISR